MKLARWKLVATAATAIAAVLGGATAATAAPVLPAAAAVPTIAWPTQDVVMHTDVTVGISGTAPGASGSVEVALQDQATSEWLHTDGSWGSKEWLDAPVVDPAGTWRFTYTPTTPGTYSVLARMPGGSDEAASSFTVVRPGQTAPVDPSEPGQPEAPPTDGTYPLSIVNDTHSRWADGDVWVFIVGQTSPGAWAYVGPDGAVHPIDSREQEGPDAIVADGIGYAPMSFRLPDDGTVQMPASLEGARVYISLGAPLYVRVAPDSSGLALPDPANPEDPNYGTYWDHYELTFVNGRVHFGANTTQVDQFGFPISARVQQDWSGFDQSTSFTASRADILAHFRALGSGYDGLVSDQRVLAPRTSDLFRDSSEASARMQHDIDAAWASYAENGLQATADARSIDGRVTSDGRLHFTADGEGNHSIAKPTPSEVWECSGSLASGDVVELALEAQLCAAFHRGVAADPAAWSNPDAYYADGTGDLYSAYLHQISANGLAYGFAYDDVHDQSSVIILPNAAPPTRVTLTIGW